MLKQEIPFSIQITVNDTLDQSKSTVQIQNLNANVNKTSLNTINASVTIPTDSIEINASITASITNYLDATLDLTETDLTAQNVFIVFRLVLFTFAFKF